VSDAKPSRAPAVGVPLRLYSVGGSNTTPFARDASDHRMDGYDKGREDARDNDSYDPVRHSRYRSADRGYEQRYGTKEEYKNIYREGFQAGYDDGYRDTGAYGPDRHGSRSRFPWPF
jgi:hypothetical protein